MNEFEALKPKLETYTGLEKFGRPEAVHKVTMISDEVTAVCPVTNQPDYYTVEITYHPRDYCIESKSLKLYFQSLRSLGIFCEELSMKILEEVLGVIHPRHVNVKVTQKARGGITIISEADLTTD